MFIQRNFRGFCCKTAPLPACSGGAYFIFPKGAHSPLGTYGLEEYNMTRKESVYRLTESAILLAFAAVLSVVKIIDMPYGGSVTAFSMLPLLVIAYRYGVRWGTFAAFTYGIIQLLLGLDNFSYATSLLAGVMILLFDYLLAFVVLGFGGVFRRFKISQGAALSLGAVTTGILRYLCHVVSGCTVWAGLSVPNREALLYSLSYNACYMIPEIILLVLGAIYLSRMLSLSGNHIARATTTVTASPIAVTVLSIAAKTALLVTAVIMVVQIFPSLQFTDGTFFLRGLISLDWKRIGLTALVGSWVFLLLEYLAARVLLRHTLPKN